MTATPKETKYISNISYFGDPLYSYSLKEGIEDGFLAPFKVINITTDIGDGWRPSKGQLDKYGNPIEDRIYTNSDYDYNIVIEDRIQQVAAEITDYLKATDRMAKTIVFCATEDAAERRRMALVNLNRDMVQKNPTMWCASPAATITARASWIISFPSPRNIRSLPPPPSCCPPARTAK